MADVSYEGEPILGGPPPIVVTTVGPSYLPPSPSPTPIPRLPPPPPSLRPTPYPPVTPYAAVTPFTTAVPLVDAYSSGTDLRTGSVLAPPQQPGQLELVQDDEEYVEYVN